MTQRVLLFASACLVAVVNSAAMAGFPDARPQRLSLQPGAATMSEVKKALGSPLQKLELHRSLLPLTAAVVCGTWDQRVFTAWVYEDTVHSDDGRELNQETRVFFNADDKLCASAVWYAAPGSHDVEQVVVDRLPEPERVVREAVYEVPMCTVETP